METYIKELNYQQFYQIYLDKITEGYIWLSNESRPYCLPDDLGKIKAELPQLEGFPYIREAMLQIEGGASIMVYHLDDRYQINHFELNEIRSYHQHTDYLLQPQSFHLNERIVQKMGYEKIQFTQIYTLQANPLNPDFKEWQHLVRVFTGFK